CTGKVNGGGLVLAGKTAGKGQGHMGRSGSSFWNSSCVLQHAQPEDSNELFQKLLEKLQIINKELRECNHPTFFDDNEDHSVQYKEYLENSSKEIAASNSNQEKEKPPQDFDIRQLVREEGCIEVCEEQNQNMVNTMLELVEVCRQKELYCMHDNVDDLIESALNSKLLSINLNSQRPDKKKYEVKNVVEQQAEHRTQSDEIIKSGVKELVPIPNECEVTSEDKRECDVLVYEDSSTFDVCGSDDDHISSDDDAFEDIEYVEASPLDLELVSLEEENVVYQEEEFNLEDIQDVVLRDKLLSINCFIANIESLNDNTTPDCVLKSSASIPIFEESDNSFPDNSSPEFETFSDYTEETRSGSTTTHDSLPEYDSFCFEIELEVDLFLASDNSIPSGIENFGYDSEGDICFLEELLIDDSIPFPNNESFDFDPSFPRPPLEPPDVEFFFDLEPDVIVEEILDELNEDNCFDPGEEIDVFANNEDDDYFPFMFVIRIFLPYLIFPKVSLLLLPARSEDTIKLIKKSLKPYKLNNNVSKILVFSFLKGT
nr:hypothetical protein [Tanacetum cinerariifolium]